MNDDIIYSIVLPTYNEEENVAEILRRLKRIFTDKSEFIISDGNSSDRTREIVKQLSSADSSIRLINNERLPGLSASVVAGFNAARGKYLACMDADLQHDETSLQAMFQLLEEYEMVVGSRYIDQGSVDEDWHWFRIFASRSANTLTRKILNIEIKDTMSGFFTLRKSVFDEVAAMLNPQGWKIMLEIAYNLKRINHQATIKEYPINFRKREKGHSKFSAGSSAMLLVMLFKLKFKALFNRVHKT